MARSRAILVVVATAASLLVGVPAGAETRPPPEPEPSPNARVAAAEPPAEADDGGAVRGVTPTRFLDTRTGAGPVGAGQKIDLQIAGVGPVPASGVSAVLLNLTATAPTAATYVTAWPAGETRPLVSNLNLRPGQTAPNLVTVGLGTNGRISLFNNQGATHLIADVLGYVVPPSDPGGKLVDLEPARLLDTRTGTGPVGPAGTIKLDVTGVGGVPDTGVSSVVLNLTATEPTASSYVTAFPTGQPRPLASNLNVVPGDTVPNRVVVPVGSDGTISLFNNAGNVHLVADIGGYYTDATVQEGGSGLLRMSPKRLLDTREAGGPLGPQGTRTVQVAGVAGIPGMDVEVPPTAVVLNMTATGPTASTFLTAWPGGLARPLASDLNVGPGETRPNLVVVKLGPTGAVDIFNNAGAVDVIVDVFAYYTGAVVTNPALKVLDASVAEAVTSVSGTTVTFAGTIAGLGLSVDDIIASGPTDGAPQGLLRRIVNLSEVDGVVTATVEAVSLDEAVPRGSYSGGIDLVPVSGGANAKGIGATVTAPFNVALEGTGPASAEIDGALTLGAELDLKAKMGFLSGVDVNFEGRLDASMSADLSVTGAYQFYGKDYDLPDIEFQRFLFFIGPVPVYVEPELEIGLGIEGRAEASFNATVSRSESLTMGFDMHNTNITPFVNSSGTPTTFTAQPPSAAVQLGAELRATLEAEFYGGFELGVGLAPALEARVDTADCGFTLDFALYALAEFEVEIFGKEIGDGLELRSELDRDKLVESTVPGCTNDAWTMDATVSPTDLANRLAGPGVTVQSATGTGNVQLGSFTAPFGSIGLDGGVALSTGEVGGIVGNNNTTSYGTNRGGPGDDALSIIAGGGTTDTADLTVQFIPTTGTVEFSFVFASEEYQEYVDSLYNDVFAAFVNGVNCAVVDKGYELVPSTVNAINHKRNTLQYRDNANNSHKIQADGLTTVLRCRAAVNPGVPNTLRLAIADTGDGVYDSWAFIQRGSLRAV